MCNIRQILAPLVKAMVYLTDFSVFLSRSSDQVKWYGQTFFRRKRLRKGDMFAPLKDKEIIVEALSKQEQEKRTPWSEGEKLLFLYGLKKLGKGRWQEIHDRFLHSRYVFVWLVLLNPQS